MKQMCFTAFDNGITHFDLANNYGPQQILENLNVPDSAPFSEEKLKEIDECSLAL